MFTLDPPPNVQFPNWGLKFGPGPYFCASLDPTDGDICPFNFCDAVMSGVGEFSCLLAGVELFDDFPSGSIDEACTELDRLGNSCPKRGDLWLSKFCRACAAATCAALVPV